MDRTAPTWPAQTSATSRWNPGRSTRPDPDLPRSSSIVTTSVKPNSLAYSARLYCRRWLSRLYRTWITVDCRTYTIARRRRWSGVTLSLVMNTSRFLRFGSRGAEQEVGQDLFDFRLLLSRHG